MKLGKGVLTKIKPPEIIFVTLILGLINGFIFVFIIPPWEHYDEPGHFEYVWLIANRLQLPKLGDLDINMRLEMGKSLIQSGFFVRRPSMEVNLTDPNQPLWTGGSQFADPPLYYALDALPLILLRGMPINTQLYAARVFSLVFFLMTLWAAYHLLAELTPEKSYLRWLIPLFMALHPALAEYMSSVSDVVGGIGLGVIVGKMIAVGSNTAASCFSTGGPASRMMT